MAFCSNCGAKLNEGTVFCQNCGAAVQGQTASVQQPQAPVQEPQITQAPPVPQPQHVSQTPYTEQYIPQTPPVKKKKTGTIVAVIVALLLVIGAAVTALVLVLGGDSDKDSGGSKDSGDAGESYESLCEAYTEARGRFDFEELDALSVISEEAVLMDYIANTDSDWDSIYEKFETLFEEGGNKISVDSIDDIYEGYGELVSGQATYSSMTASAGDYEKLDDAEISSVYEELVDEFEYAFGKYDLDFADYVALEDITEGYKFTMTLSAVVEGESVSADNTLHVVKHKGEWKMLYNDLIVLTGMIG